MRALFLGLSLLALSACGMNVRMHSRLNQASYVALTASKTAVETTAHQRVDEIQQTAPSDEAANAQIAALMRVYEPVEAAMTALIYAHNAHADAIRKAQADGGKVSRLLLYELARDWQELARLARALGLRIPEPEKLMEKLR